MLRDLLRDFARLARPFWASRERGRAVALAAGMALLTAAFVGIAVALNALNGGVFDALDKRKPAAFWSVMGYAAITVTAYVAVFASQQYLMRVLVVRWRRHMTEDLLARWTTGRAFYFERLAGPEGQADNPDQRISEDARDFTDLTVTLAQGAFQQSLTLVGFVGTLWSLSGVVSLPLGGGRALPLPGSMAWACLLYALAGSWLAHAIGRALLRLNFEQQRKEADFRFGLARLREHAESVALSGGADAEHAALRARFGRAADNQLAMAKRQKYLDAFTSFYNNAATFFPLVIAGPRYFAGGISLGDLAQVSGAFGQVQGALSFFINSYATVARLGAVTRRLTGFVAAMDAAAALEARAKSLVDAESPDGAVPRSSELRAEGLVLCLPDGAPLLDGVDVTLSPGRSLLVSGPSGAGKSTLLRTLAGAWPFATAGRVGRPRGFDGGEGGGGGLMVLPQKPYLPEGTLRAALCYPSPDGAFDDGALREALDECRIPHLAHRLSEEAPWSAALSPGEQQRVSLARALLHRPAWLFLDEATSALDEPTEEAVYRSLRAALPDTAVLSVGHRRTLVPLHDEHQILGGPIGGSTGGATAHPVAGPVPKL